jgi:hypothetical protein
MTARFWKGATLTTLLLASAVALAAGPAQLTKNSPLPADPGAAGMATLAGVDANANLVRDDLEPFLHEYFGNNAQVLRAMSNMLIGLQATITAATPQQSARAQLMTIRATECLLAARPQMVQDSARDQKMVALLVNTPARSGAIAEHQKRIAGQSFTMRELPEWEIACDVRADLADRTIALPPSPQ